MTRIQSPPPLPPRPSSAPPELPPRPQLTQTAVTPGGLSARTPRAAPQGSGPPRVALPNLLGRPADPPESRGALGEGGKITLQALQHAPGRVGLAAGFATAAIEGGSGAPTKQQALKGAASATFKFAVKHTPVGDAVTLGKTAHKVAKGRLTLSQGLKQGGKAALNLAKMAPGPLGLAAEVGSAAVEAAAKAPSPQKALKKGARAGAKALAESNPLTSAAYHGGVAAAKAAAKGAGKSDIALEAAAGAALGVFKGL